MFFRKKTQDTDLDWIDGCKKGNAKAQEMLYQHYYGYVMTICLRYSQKKEEAAEILNDSFFKVFTQIDKYDKSFDFKQWLRKLVVNTAIDYSRKKERQQPFATEDLQEAAEELSPDWADSFATEEILQLLKELPDNHRIVFNLYEIEGYTHEEIAAQMGITESVSRTFLSRAKQKLKQVIEKSYSNFI